MKKTRISVQLNNKDMPYTYTGDANINDSIIEFIDNDYNYIFDKKVRRLLKSNRYNSITIDFLQKEITIKENDKEYSMKIEVKKYKVEENNIEIIYNIGNDDIELKMKEV